MNVRQIPICPFTSALFRQFTYHLGSLAYQLHHIPEIHNATSKGRIITYKNLTFHISSGTCAKLNGIKATRLSTETCEPYVITQRRGVINTVVSEDAYGMLNRFRCNSPKCPTRCWAEPCSSYSNTVFKDNLCMCMVYFIEEVLFRSELDAQNRILE